MAQIDPSRRRRAPIHPTGAQLRAARALIGISAAELADAAGVSLNTVKRAEAADGLSPVTAANAKLIVDVLQGLGVAFIGADEGGGVGVRLKLGG